MTEAPWRCVYDLGADVLLWGHVQKSRSRNSQEWTMAFKFYSGGVAPISDILHTPLIEGCWSEALRSSPRRTSPHLGNQRRSMRDLHALSPSRPSTHPPRARRIPPADWHACTTSWWMQTSCRRDLRLAAAAAADASLMSLLPLLLVLVCVVSNSRDIIAAMNMMETSQWLRTFEEFQGCERWDKSLLNSSVICNFKQFSICQCFRKKDREYLQSAVYMTHTEERQLTLK